MKEHNVATPNECRLCGMFFSASRFNKHLCKGKSVQCEHCASESFNTTSSLLQHLELHKNECLMKRCDKCPSLFSTNWELECHSQTHQVISTRHVCKICGASYKTSSGLLYHKVSHTNGNVECVFLLHKCSSNQLIRCNVIPLQFMWAVKGKSTTENTQNCGNVTNANRIFHQPDIF